MKNHMQRLPHLITAPVLIINTFLMAVPPIAAQPDLNETPKAVNPPSRERGGRGGLNRGNVTIPQQLQFRREAAVRAMLTQAGFADADIQDPIVAHLEARRGLQPKVREATLKMVRATMQARGVRPGAEGGVPANTLSEAQVTALITEYHAAVETDRAAREEAEKSLDAKIKFSQNPRLEMTLILLGALGDGSSLTTSGGAVMGALMMRDRPGGLMRGGPMPAFPFGGGEFGDFGPGGFDGDERGNRAVNPARPF